MDAGAPNAPHAYLLYPSLSFSFTPLVMTSHTSAEIYSLYLKEISPRLEPFFHTAV